MVKEILSGLFCIQVPLPNSPLKYLNSYVIRGKDRSLVIDTGFNEETCFETMSRGLRDIGVRMDAADIFITHLHADHFSLVPRLRTKATRVFFNRPEAEIIENWQGFQEIFDYSARHGFPQGRLEKAFDAHPGTKFGTDWAPHLDIVNPGDQLTYGDYTFACLATPGHSLGHLCLYAAAQKVLISGDHILIDITPNIQCWRDDYNPLASYLASLKETRQLDVELVLPGHRRQFRDHRRRIDELLSHHDQRLAEVRTILSKGPLTAFTTAAAMTWDIKADSWDDFPVAQQWFATGEALAHLRYLERSGEITEQTDNSLTVFQLPHDHR